MTDETHHAVDPDSCATRGELTHFVNRASEIIHIQENQIQQLTATVVNLNSRLTALEKYLNPDYTDSMN